MNHNLISLNPWKPVFLMDLVYFLSFFILIFDESYLCNVVVRGENTRRVYAGVAKRRTAIAPKILDEQLTAIICLQAGRNYVVDQPTLLFSHVTQFLSSFSFCFNLPPVIRGWLVRKHFNYIHNLKQANSVNAKSKRRPGRKSSEMKVFL